MKRSNPATILSVTIIAFFLMTGVSLPADWTLGTDTIYVNDTKVGIGTTTPGYTLDVNGSARITTQLQTTSSFYENSGLYRYYRRSWDVGYQDYMHYYLTLFEKPTATTGEAMTVVDGDLTVVRSNGLGVTVAAHVVAERGYSNAVRWNVENRGGTKVEIVEVPYNSKTWIALHWYVAANAHYASIDMRTLASNWDKLGLGIFKSSSAIHSSLANSTPFDTSFSGGNVGIGTATPVYKLDVIGDMALRGDTFYLGENQSPAIIRTKVYGGAIKIRGDSATSDRYVQLGYTDNANNYYPTLTADTNGNVGIGTTSPNYKLDVLGTIRATEVKVETGWSDYVFDKNYALPSLAQVESYIKDNKHLPEIPSAKEIQDSGLSVAEMMAKQMQKIEELTLYVIEQNKQINQMKNELAELKKQN